MSESQDLPGAATEQLPKPGPRQKRTGAPRGNQNARKHGLHPLRRLVSVRGLSAIDGRSAVAVALREKRQELEAHVGAARLTEPRRIIIEQIIRRILFLESIDAWLLEQPSLVIKRRRTLIPALLERERLAAGLVRDLEAIGLDREAVPAPDLGEWLAKRDRERKQAEDVTR